MLTSVSSSLGRISPASNGSHSRHRECKTFSLRVNTSYELWRNGDYNVRRGKHELNAAATRNAYT